MDCRRCHGMMVEERFEDVRSDPRELSFYGWRCVCCGNIADPVIAANRVRPSLAPYNDPIRRLMSSAIETWDLDAA